MKYSDSDDDRFDEIVTKFIDFVEKVQGTIYIHWYLQFYLAFRGDRGLPPYYWHTSCTNKVRHMIKLLKT